MARLKPVKLSASTIIEVLISLVIIMVVFTISIGIYQKVTGSNFSLKGRQVRQQMLEMLNESKEKSDFKDYVTEEEEIEYAKTALPYKNFKDLIQVEIQARQNGKIIDTLKQVILIKTLEIGN